MPHLIYYLQPPLSTTEFKSKALPLHVNLTHTPPSIIEKVESDVAVASGSELVEVNAPVVGDDVGFIESLTLLPSSFSTGSYGWKGSKRVIVELQDGDGEGDKEKVQVMLSYARFYLRLILVPFLTNSSAGSMPQSLAVNPAEKQAARALLKLKNLRKI